MTRRRVASRPRSVREGGEVSAHPSPSGCKIGEYRVTPRCVNSRGRGPSRLELLDMSDSTTLPDGPNPSGLCMCGCGRPAPTASRSRKRDGHVAGRPMRFIQGHGGRVIPPFDDPNPSGVCMCGCGQTVALVAQTHSAQGLYAGHHPMFAHGHNGKSAAPEFLADPSTGCWIWQRSINRDGYALTHQGGRTRLAHRVYYERANGPVPAGLEVDHLCRKRDCVNPAHLEAVTPAENSRRKPSTRLNACQVAIIRAMGASRESVAASSRLFGISSEYVSRLLRGERWAAK